MNVLKKLAENIFEFIIDLFFALLDLPAALIESIGMSCEILTVEISLPCLILYAILGIVNCISFFTTHSFVKWTFITSIIFTSIYEALLIVHSYRIDFDHYAEHLSNMVPCHIGLIASIYMLIKYF